MNEEQLDKQLEELQNNDETKGERYYGRKFKSAYTQLRKGLVIIKKVRIDVSSEVAVKKAKELIERVLLDLE